MECVFVMACIVKGIRKGRSEVLEACDVLVPLLLSWSSGRVSASGQEAPLQAPSIGPPLPRVQLCFVDFC